VIIKDHEPEVLHDQTIEPETARIESWSTSTTLASCWSAHYQR
jgi:hypothetical protein